MLFYVFIPYDWKVSDLVTSSVIYKCMLFIFTVYCFFQGDIGPAGSVGPKGSRVYSVCVCVCVCVCVLFNMLDMFRDCEPFHFILYSPISQITDSPQRAVQSLHIRHP